jgi:acyl-homoserine-lactone acylase
LLCHAQGRSFAGSAAAERHDGPRRRSDVTIVRDDWGIAHVYGKTDADTVFGMIYAQSEDDFNRVETNYLNAMGRLAEAEGEGKVYQDLRMKMFIDPEDLKKDYAASPEWLKKLMDAFADGPTSISPNIPQVKPRVIQHFEPWMALSFTEGSIGGDIERVDLKKLEAFYGGHKERVAAVAGAAGPGARWIEWNRHCALQHRAASCAAADQSAHLVFLSLGVADGQRRRARCLWGGDLGPVLHLPGFQPALGWMHTSSGVDAVDEYLETVHSKDGHYFYKYGDGERPVTEKQITVPYRPARNGGEEVHRVLHPSRSR